MFAACSFRLTDARDRVELQSPVVHEPEQLDVCDHLHPPSPGRESKRSKGMAEHPHVVPRDISGSRTIANKKKTPPFKIREDNFPPSSPRDALNGFIPLIPFIPYISLTDRQTRQTDRPTDRQTDRQTNRQTDRQTDRHKDGQTGKRTRPPSSNNYVSNTALHQLISLKKNQNAPRPSEHPLVKGVWLFRLVTVHA